MHIFDPTGALHRIHQSYTNRTILYAIGTFCALLFLFGAVMVAQTPKPSPAIRHRVNRPEYLDTIAAEKRDSLNRINFCINLIVSHQWQNWTTNPYCVGVAEELAIESIQRNYIPK